MEYENEQEGYYYSGKINYDPECARKAFDHLMNMQNLEDMPNFGKLKEQIPSKRYKIEKYIDKIDSTFYTDMATSILGRTIYQFEGWNESYVSYLFSGKYNYDLTNNSLGEFANFLGDASFFELEGEYLGDQLYYYYSEFQLVTGEEKQIIIDRLDNDLSDNEIIVKKTENINGEEMDFYYVAYQYYEINSYLLQHDYNTKFYKDRMPGNVLNAIKKYYGQNDIITVSWWYAENMNRSEEDDRWAAYANWLAGYIVVRDNYFTETICHETGHLFDMISVSQNNLLYPVILAFDFPNDWKFLALQEADDIELIRKGAEIGCGYDAQEMIKMPYEFFAEAFQLYFYSEETRAALPADLRLAIESEIEKYCQN